MLSPTVSSTASKPAAPFSDTLIMVGRSLRLASRNLEVLLTALILPVMLMVLFVYLFGGAIDTGTAYVTYVVPGVLLLCAGYGASLTAVSVSQDMTSGIIDRFRSLDVSGAALLAGHVVASVLRNLISTILVLGVALLIGFRPSAGPLEWLEAGGILVAYIFALSWLSAVVGLFAKSPEAASGFSFFFLFLPYPSCAFVPIATMPSWIQGFAQHQPVTPVTETLRGLLIGTPVGSSPWISLTWCGGILVVSVVLASFLFPRRAA
jgi:ABC-2 type transport system permease protein